ncbi:MAG: ORC1-type DNA replication protein [Methanocorpusculum sp.]|nr:ORC1-type DNA replication protein [Methanocorpusculum sp.]
MKSNLLNWDQTLFKDIEVFDISYVPEQFEYRDEQMAELALSIRPALMGGKILPTVCKGLPGTGKTTSVRKLFEEIDKSTKKIIPISINCQIDNTEYAVFSRIYSKITKHSPPSSGTAFKSLMDGLLNYIEKEGVLPLVCLDDANYLIYQKQFNDILYPLLRIHEQKDGISFGVIVVISDMSIDLESVIDARVGSVFRYETINFAPYTSNEVAGILSARIKQGLYPRVLSTELLDKIVDRTMKCGDVRMGLDLIKRSVLYAENDARKEVLEKDVLKAFSASRDLHLSTAVRSLSKDEYQVLSKIVKLSTGEKSPTTSEIRDAIPEKGPKVTRVNEIIEKLDMMHLVTTEYSNTGKGRQRFVHLKYDKERMERILKRK